MKYIWARVSVDDVSRELPRYEDDGWEIFTVYHAPGDYYKTVILRKPR